VPANTIKDTVYELTSTFRLYCCGKPGPIVGFEPKEEYQCTRELTLPIRPPRPGASAGTSAAPATKEATMPDDDLSSISGLDDGDVTCSRRSFGVSTCYELIMATVSGSSTRSDGARSGHARRSLRVAGRGAPNPRRVDRCRRLGPRGLRMAVGGYLVVAFEERGQRETLERRIVVEQTEVEPSLASAAEAMARVTCDDTCRWMLERVGARPLRRCQARRRRPPGGRCPRGRRPAEAGPPGTGAPGTGAPDTALPTPATERLTLRPGLRRLTSSGEPHDAGGSSEVVADSRPVTQDRLVCLGQRG